MGRKSSFIEYVLSNKLNLRIVFILMFAVFGLIIAFVSYFVSSYYEVKSIKIELINSANNNFLQNKTVLKNRIKSFENILFSIKTSSSFKTYLEMKDTNTKSINDIFSTSMKTNDELMQIRYLDKSGQEVLRIDRKNIGGKIYLVPFHKLQNKKDRYYFKEVKNLSEGSIWTSKMDLNIEDGKIVKPITPTLRLATAIYSNNEFRGIIILNIFIEKLIKEISSSSFFKVSILDKEGNFIHHIEKNDISEIDYSWSQYLDKNYSLKDLYPKFYKNILNSKRLYVENIFSQDVSSTFYNPDELKFLYEAKTDKIEQMQKKQSEYIITIALIIFFISIPLSLILSIVPIKLSNRLLEIKAMLSEKDEIIDNYVAISTTNKKGIITNVSTAFCHLTGYEKEELIGKTHNLISSKDTNTEVHENIWNSITSDGKWNGEMKNQSKEGSEIWVNLKINALRNEKGETISYLAYHEDISNSKRLFNVSIKDALTSLYNRRYFDQMFNILQKKAKNEKEIFCFIIADIDHFKLYNDTYGHFEGDKALASVALVLKSYEESNNAHAFRIGGEEFALLFCIKEKEDIKDVVNKILKDIKELEIEHKASTTSKNLTISMGAYVQELNDNLSLETMFVKTDEALYSSKTTGRNKISYCQN